MAEVTLLIGRKAIMEAFKMSDVHFNILASQGMPFVKINGKIYGHFDNINLFLKEFTFDRREISADEKYTPENDKK